MTGSGVDPSASSSLSSTPVVVPYDDSFGPGDITFPPCPTCQGSGTIIGNDWCEAEADYWCESTQDQASCYRPIGHDGPHETMSEYPPRGVRDFATYIQWTDDDNDDKAGEDAPSR